MKIGDGRIAASFTIGELQICGTFWPFGWETVACPPGPGKIRLKSVAVALGGRVASALLFLALRELWLNFLPNLPRQLAAPLVILTILQAGMVVSSLIPRAVKVDGRFVPNDALLAWRLAGAKGTTPVAAYLVHVLPAADVYLERGQVRKALLLVENGFAESQTDCIGASVAWIWLLLEGGNDAGAWRVRRAILDGELCPAVSRVNVLDALACLPIIYGLSDWLEQGLEDIEAALREAPDLITLKGTKASLLIEMGRLEEGMRLIDEVSAFSESQNDQAIVSYYKALAVSRLRDAAAGRKLLEEAIQNYPDCVVRKRIESLLRENIE